jgi:hypothetical protein
MGPAFTRKALRRLSLQLHGLSDVQQFGLRLDAASISRRVIWEGAAKRLGTLRRLAPVAALQRQKGILLGGSGVLGPAAHGLRDDAIRGVELAIGVQRLRDANQLIQDWISGRHQISRGGRFRAFAFIIGMWTHRLIPYFKGCNELS